MDFKLHLVALLLALVVAFEAATLNNVAWGLARYSHSSLIHGRGEVINRYSKSHHVYGGGEILDEDHEMMPDSEASHRNLAGRPRYISYGALKRNGIPCRRRGVSYYNCGQPAQQANTYHRGCSVITRCARFN